MGFGNVISSIGNDAVTEAVLWVADFQTPLTILLGLGVFMIAAGALVSWIR